MRACLIGSPFALRGQHVCSIKVAMLFAASKTRTYDGAIDHANNRLSKRFGITTGSKEQTR